MYVIQRDLGEVSRSDTFTIKPIADVHLGSAACDEQRLAEDIERIRADDRCYWVGLGDMAEFINIRDPRFDPAVLADWIGAADLVDLARAQRDRFLEHIRPIAGKCLALVEGNHEIAIRKHFERDIYAEIVSEVKAMAGLPEDAPLGLGVYGWLLLHTQRIRQSGVLYVNLHHGFATGRLAGSKALNMQRWLWTHNADLVLFGHAHIVGVQTEQVEAIDHRGNLVSSVRRGVYCGTYLRTVNKGGPAVYSEERGYMPLPAAGVEIVFRPGHVDRGQWIQIVA